MRGLTNLLTKIKSSFPTSALELVTADSWRLDENSVNAVPEAVTWSANMTPDGTVSTHNITATSGIATAVAIPSPLVPGVIHRFAITNGHVAAMGAMTFAAGYLMPATPVLPAVGQTITLEFLAISATQLRQWNGLGTGGSSSLPVGVVTPAWGAAITIDRSLGNVFNVVAATNAAYTYGAPSVSVPGDRITIRFQNASGVTSGAAAFNAVYALRGFAIGALANGVGYEISFVCLAASGAGSWEEESRASILATQTAIVLGRSTAGAGPVEEIPFTAAAMTAAALPLVIGVQLSAELVVTPAELLALPTNAAGLVLLAAPGAGIVRRVIGWRLKTSIAGNVTNIDAAATLELHYTNQAGLSAGASMDQSGGVLTSLLATAGTRWGHHGPDGAEGALAAFENAALVFTALNAAAGNFTGGNAANTYTVRAIYVNEPIA